MRTARTLAAILLLTSAICMAQSEKKASRWDPIKFLVGEWEGTSHGQAGQGKVTRDYAFVLEGRFLQARNKSVYPPQEKNPKGEVHQDWGLFSYDRGRQRLVLRQFHVEGFVNQYVQDTSPDARSTVFVSEAIENIPKGWRARETYILMNENEFIERFELAEPGKDFDLYSESRLFRKTK